MTQIVVTFFHNPSGKINSRNEFTSKTKAKELGEIKKEIENIWPVKSKAMNYTISAKEGASEFVTLILVK